MARAEELVGKLVELEPNGFSLTPDEILADYRIAHQSRLASLAGTKEVRAGRATFGIFGDGKEVAELAMARAFRKGDFRAGYYRDQTFMFATGMSDLGKFFAQLYGTTDISAEPAAGGRQMPNHFASRLLDSHGRFADLMGAKNSSADLSPTGGQMARLLGLAYASKLYRHEPALADRFEGFSNQGNEVAFGTIGNAGTSEGVFFETLNAAGVLQVPMAISVWDDGYGISVPNELQTTHRSISEALRGLQWSPETGTGIDIYVIKGWDYASLCVAYQKGIERVRSRHIPAMFHIVDMTQPQGHSSSGSHERYKPRERLDFERAFDPLSRMRSWIESRRLFPPELLDEVEADDHLVVEGHRRAAWTAHMAPIRRDQRAALSLLDDLSAEVDDACGIEGLADSLRSAERLNRRLINSTLFSALTATCGHVGPARGNLVEFLSRMESENDRRFNSHLYSESDESPLRVAERKPTYSATSEVVDGRQVLQRCFDHHLKKDARLFIVGEDVGKLGDVNLVFQDLNARYGDLRVTDTGIRESTILGQGIGAALRGLRPLVDIQYLDYLPFALQTLMDDLATLHHRSAGGQKAPVIIRTKGHRFDGIWHTGSPMAMLLHSCRGVYLAVPRDMTRAAGFYNTLMQSDNPGIVIEVLRGYRTKERVPDNIGTFTVPLGVPETLRSGSDVTLVTYAECCNIAMEAARVLEDLDVDVEVIDVQTLNPFDVRHSISESLAKTNAVLFLDEDVPGGASAYMMQQVLEVQEGWQHLDAPPRTLTAKENRSPYGIDGGYFSKPNVHDVVSACYQLASEIRPGGLPPLR
ncbi:MAG TPA: thiamine pyrophosphate-dependent enzyme [Actinomycetota bacterium]|nr:thiamine pyrophosphate-dependent enzyme [Actinomycetota bacterium]